jgi:hypothetical protein
LNRAGLLQKAGAALFLEPVGLPADRDDGAVMQEPIEDSGGDDGVAEDFSPIADGPVGCDEDGALLIAAGDELEEEMRSVWVERQIAQFVDDQPSWTNVGGSSLAQYINHTGNTTISGGETIYGFYLDTAGGTNFTNTQQELALVRDMGTSILGGGQSAANAGIYPDGPDVVTIVAQNIGTATASCAARLSWTEAQA